MSTVTTPDETAAVSPAIIEGLEDNGSSVSAARKAGLRKEFVVERQGKSFVLYAGLLDLAHQRGLTSITSELLQVPNEANNRVAICKATVSLSQGENEKVQVFEGIGDAAPNNVAPAMQTCLIRMAETRAKARALRDAVNVGVAAFEELSLDDNATSAPAQASRPARQSRTATPARTEAAPEKTQADAPMTRFQESEIKRLCVEFIWELPDTEGWTQGRAGKWLYKAQQSIKATATP